MSTVFCVKLSAYLIHAKDFSFNECLRQVFHQTLTGPRVSEAGRPHLYTSCTYGQVVKHVGGRLYASEPYDWCGYGAERFPNQAQCNGLDRRAGKPSCP